MEKLSSILPSSPRVKNVDMADAQPVRPGVTAYGRPVGANPIKDRIALSQEAKDLAFKDTMGTINPKEKNSVKIVEDLSKKFFENKVGADLKAGPASQETQERSVEIDENLPLEKAEPNSVPRERERLDLRA